MLDTVRAVDARWATRRPGGAHAGRPVRGRLRGHEPGPPAPEPGRLVRELVGLLRRGHQGCLPRACPPGASSRRDQALCLSSVGPAAAASRLPRCAPGSTRDGPTTSQPPRCDAFAARTARHRLRACGSPSTAGATTGRSGGRPFSPMLVFAGHVLRGSRDRARWPWGWPARWPPPWRSTGASCSPARHGAASAEAVDPAAPPAHDAPRALRAARGRRARRWGCAAGRCTWSRSPGRPCRWSRPSSPGGGAPVPVARWWMARPVSRHEVVAWSPGRRSGDPGHRRGRLGGRPPPSGGGSAASGGHGRVRWRSRAPARPRRGRRPWRRPAGCSTAGPTWPSRS